jgi:putative transposase
VRRAYKLRAYPTRPQEGRAVRLLGDHCELDNAALAERREAWRMRNRSVSYGDQSAQLKQIRAADPDGQGRHSFTAQQQTLRRLNAVFAAYFRRVKEAEKAGQRAGRKGEKPRVRRVGYPRFKPWYVIVVTETGAMPLASTGRSVGVDLGVARFLTTSDGAMVATPRFLAATQQRIVDLQRRKQRARPRESQAAAAGPRQRVAQAPQPAGGLPPQDRPWAGRLL